MIPRPQKDSQGKIEGKFYPLQKAELIGLRKAGLIDNTAFVYFALHLEDLQNGAPLNVKEFATSWQIPESSVYEAIAKINRANPSFTVKVKSPVRVEQQIRDYLDAQLGGLAEVATPARRIDLLTDSEIIEVKAFKDWKAALGQVLVYSAFYPEHQKRIHLFGSASEIERLADIQAACMSFLTSGLRGRCAMAKTSSEQAKVKTPLHLRLTNEDWVDTFKALTRAELGVFYWIRTKDPYGDRELEINCADLGRELEIHKSSVSRALQSLASKKLLELELISVKVRQKISNRRLTLLCKGETESNQEKTEKNKTVALVQQQAHQCNKQPPKPPPDKASSTPQTIQTYTDFIQTLSEAERENFLNFCLELASNLSSPVNDIEAWLAHKNKAGQNRWEVYHEKFLAWQGKQTKQAKSSSGSQMMKKFQQEIEQQRQQAIQTWGSKV